jgi:hypothetical protein
VGVCGDQTARDGMAEFQGLLLAHELKADGTDCHGLDESYGGVVALAFRWYFGDGLMGDGLIGVTSKIYYNISGVHWFNAANFLGL